MKSWPKIDGALADYVDGNWLRDSPLKRRLREETAKMPGAGMQISAHQGQQIGLLARAVGARRAVEVGTFTGYSRAVHRRGPAGRRQALVLRRQRGMDQDRQALLEGGRAGRAASSSPSPRRSRRSTGCWPRVSAGQLDLAFIDADKTNYDAYYERCLKLVRRGGLLLIDNVLWGGSVANLADKDADTEAIRALNAKLRKDERVDLTLFAVGDGMTCALKR